MLRLLYKKNQIHDFYNEIPVIFGFPLVFIKLILIWFWVINVEMLLNHEVFTLGILCNIKVTNKNIIIIRSFLFCMA